MVITKCKKRGTKITNLCPEKALIHEMWAIIDVLDREAARPDWSESDVNMDEILRVLREKQ